MTTNEITVTTYDILMSELQYFMDVNAIYSPDDVFKTQADVIKLYGSFIPKEDYFDFLRDILYMEQKIANLSLERPKSLVDVLNYLRVD